MFLQNVPTELLPRDSSSRMEESSPKEHVTLSQRNEDESREGEAECRVCRGPAEPDDPLFSPCRCSGSIMFCHQECLLQWLKHSNKERCELCDHKFSFNPVYAEDAPQKLPLFLVLSKVVRRMVTEWVPFVLRVLLSFSLWLVVVPLVTSWLYRIWIHPSGSFSERLSFSCIWRDCISGFIVAAAIILSFLCLMSFADFLRFHWDVPDANMGFDRNIREPVAQAEVVEMDRGVEQDGLDLPGAPVNQQVPPGVPHVDRHGVEGREGDPIVAPPPNPPQAPNPVIEEEEEHLEEVLNREEEMDEVFGLDNPDIEVHVAVDELLGIRGPVYVLLRNLLWLLAFNCAYLGLFGFVPLSMGISLLRFLHDLDLKPRENSNIMTMMRQVSKTADEEDHTLRLADLATIALGYFVLSLVIFTSRSIIRAMNHNTDITVLGKIRLGLDCVAAVVKVGILLFLKMLLLPLLLGVCFDAATLTMFETEAVDRVQFTAQNLVGSLLLHWVLGITFMLFVTVSVLQLREVVHPDIFAATIRPQEPHPDLLGSLLQESGATHARRMIMSLAIYLVLLFALIWLPTWVLNEFVPSALPVTLNLFYIVPQLQVPVELVLFHLSVLAFLEKFKNKMGELQHSFLVTVCAKLGLTEYLLPLPNSGGPPLVRPPPGWDDLVGGTHGRWAWGTEEKTPLELSLAPRQKPTLSILRLIILFFASWLTVLTLMLIGSILPLLLGRALLATVRVSSHYRHDPIAFGVGLCVAVALKVVIKNCIDGFVPWYNRLTANPPPLGAMCVLFCFFFLWLGVIPMLLGVVFEVTFITSVETWDEFGFSLLGSLQEWVFGMLLLHVWAGFMLSGWLDDEAAGRAAAVGRGRNPQTAPVDGRPHLKLNLEIALVGLRDALSGVWDDITMKLLLWDVALPVLLWILQFAAFPIAGAFISRTRASEDESPSSLLSLSSFRNGMATVALISLLSQLNIPFSDWFQSMHDSIRDEQYLVGLELQDFQRPPQRTGQVPPMSTAVDQVD